MVGKRIHRVTLFKVPDPEAQKKLVEAYEVLAKTQLKDDKPYIQYLCAGATTTQDEARAQGYTVVAKAEFASLDDMKFYDEQCPAHGALKKTAGSLGLAAPPLTVYFEGTPQLLV